MDTEIVTETVDTTDDLTAFEAEFFGTAVKTEEVTPEDVPSETQDEDEGDAPTEDTPEEPVDEPADEEEEDDGEDEEETELFKVKRKKSAGERIRELTAARREAERREADLRVEMERLRSEAKTEDTKPKAAEVSAPLAEDAPNPDSVLEDGTQQYPLGEFDPRYIRDLTRYTIRVENEAAKAELAKAEEAKHMLTAERELISQWSVKLDAAKEAIPDLEEKAAEIEDTFRDIQPDYGKYLASTIMSMEKGPEVLHYLATNIGEAKKIVASGPTAATLALGRIEARFDSKTVSSEKPRTSKAPTPPPTNRGHGGKFSVAPDTDDLDAFETQFFNRKR